MKTARLVAVLFLLAASGGIVGYMSLRTPYAGFRGVTLVEIPRGAGTRAMGSILADAGVIRYPWQFIAARALRPAATLQAGEYRFDRPAPVWDVFDRLARGDVFFHELVVPEGHNLFDIAGSLEKLRVAAAAGFLQVARDPSPIRDLAPEAQTLEGYLFPDTYRVSRQTSAEELCRRMTGRFRVAWAELGAGAPVHRTVTMASLVEKETAVAEERQQVAAVFINRLRRNMRLQSDPTIIYGITGGERQLDRPIRRSDISESTPYNTYRIDGLPPTPIANPGREAIAAVLQPGTTDHLYFVADGSGGHAFATTLNEHNANVRRWRATEQEAASEPAGKDGGPDEPAAEDLEAPIPADVSVPVPGETDARREKVDEIMASAAGPTEADSPEPDPAVNLNQRPIPLPKPKPQRD